MSASKRRSSLQVRHLRSWKDSQNRMVRRSLSKCFPNGTKVRTREEFPLVFSKLDYLCRLTRFSLSQHLTFLPSKVKRSTRVEPLCLTGQLLYLLTTMNRQGHIRISKRCWDWQRDGQKRRRMRNSRPLAFSDRYQVDMRNELIRQGADRWCNNRRN
jgi:hypothetical protein